jgi:hypothetical protein
MKFGETRPEWYVFPFGKPQPTDPTRPATSFKTVWGAIKKEAGVTGRWHDNRHRADSPVMPNVSKEDCLPAVWRGVPCLADRWKSA